MFVALPILQSLFQPENSGIVSPAGQMPAGEIIPQIIRKMVIFLDTKTQLYTKEILVLNGSPNMLGSTFRMIQQFQQALTDHDLDHYMLRQYDFFNMDIKPCNDCGSCKHGLCHKNHLDGYSDILEAMQSAEIVILAAPVYYASFAAPLKAFIDRSHQFYQNDFKGRDVYFPNKGMGFLFMCAGHGDEKQQQAITSCAEMFFYSINRSLEGTVFVNNTTENPNFYVDFNEIVQAIHNYQKQPELQRKR